MHFDNNGIFCHPCFFREAMYCPSIVYSLCGFSMVAFGFRNIDIDDPFSSASHVGRAVHVLDPDPIDPGSNPSERCHSVPQ